MRITEQDLEYHMEHSKKFIEEEDKKWNNVAKMLITYWENKLKNDKNK